MTVKGNHHSIKSPQEQEMVVTSNHNKSNKVQNGSSLIAKSPPKDSNLNHYRMEKATPSTKSPIGYRKEREKRISSQELTLLDHRGGDIDMEKKQNRRSREQQNSTIGSPCLFSFIYPLITDLQRKHHYNGRSSDSSSKSNDAIEELKNAFEIAERTSPGISEAFICELVQKLVPSMTDQRLKGVLDKATR